MRSVIFVAAVAGDLWSVERHRLPNGLEVRGKERRETQAVEVRVVVKVGFRNLEHVDNRAIREHFSSGHESNSRLADLHQRLLLSVPFGFPIASDFAAAEALDADVLMKVAKTRLRDDALMFVVARPPLAYTGAAIAGVVVVLLIAGLVLLRLRRRRAQ